MGRLVLDTKEFLDGKAAGDPLRDEVPEAADENQRRTRACSRISPRTAQAPSATSCSGWRTTPSCSVVAGFLWTFVSPEAAFIYLGAWMLIALAALLRAR